MKILFLSNVPSPYRVDFFNELGKKSQLTVCFEGIKARNRNEKWKGNAASFYTEVFLKGVRTGNEAFFCPGIIKYLKKEWDFIIIGGYSTPTQMISIEYLKDNNIPFILEADGGFIKTDSKIKHRIKKHFISSASYWLSSGLETTNYFTYYGAVKERCFIYPFSSVRDIDIKSAQSMVNSSTLLRKKLGINDGYVVISVGQFIYRKGIDVLIKAIPHINTNAEFYIVGGDPTPEYKELIFKNNIKNIHFVSFLKKEELYEYYACSDLFVLPTREDIWGLVINEAMSFGLPIITTDKCIAGKELFNDNGRLVHVDSIKELAESIDYILKNDIERNKMRCKSLEKIEHYTIEKMAETHLQILNQLISN